MHMGKNGVMGIRGWRREVEGGNETKGDKRGSEK